MRSVWRKHCKGQALCRLRVKLNRAEGRARGGCWCPLTFIFSLMSLISFTPTLLASGKKTMI